MRPRDKDIYHTIVNYKSSNVRKTEANELFTKYVDNASIEWSTSEWIKDTTLYNPTKRSPLPRLETTDDKSVYQACISAVFDSSNSIVTKVLLVSGDCF